MFENVGEKLKTLSKILMIISSILGIIAGIKMFNTSGAPTAIIIIIISPIASYVSFLSVYGIGEILVRTESYRDHNSRNKEIPSNYSDKAANDIVVNSEHAPVVKLDNHNECFCPSCNAALSFEYTFGLKQCPHCKKHFKIEKK
ncbi:MAG: hypothetical protein J6Q85_06395 [Clostridia bacterium]|nr:hypothetical protein [Clostridia bacterium]